MIVRKSCRRLVRLCILLAATSGAAPASAQPPAGVSAEAWELHRGALLFDGHNNLVRALLKRESDTVETIDLTRFQQGLHTDIPRLRQGGVGAEFVATYVSPESVERGTAVVETLEQLDAIKLLVQRYPDFWELARSTEELQQSRKEGKLAVMLAVENGDAIAGSLAVLRSYHQAGVRCLALTHDNTHSWADAALDRALHGGLSDFGQQVVLEANRLGVAIDLSHASEDTIRDTLAISAAPVLFSHSGAYQIGPHPRNLSDDLLRLVARHGGVVNVNFFGGFLTAETVEAYRTRSEAAHELRRTFASEEQYRLALTQWLSEHPLPATTVSDVVDHIDHIVSVAGIDHVGLGSNFDGIVSVPRDLNDVSCFPRITQELLNRGYSHDQIRQILGGNTLRVLETVERVAKAGGAPAVTVTLSPTNAAAQ